MGTIEMAVDKVKMAEALKLLDKAHNLLTYAFVDLGIASEYEKDRSKLSRTLEELENETARISVKVKDIMKSYY
jgi:hypothetical protein